VRAAGALLDEAVQSLLPAAISLPRALGDDAKKTFFLSELRYCGAGKKGGGRFRAAGRLGAGRDRSQPLFATDSSCSESLSEVAGKASPALAAGSVLVDLEATWKSWELRLSVARGVVVDKEGGARALSGPAKPVEMLKVRTSDLRIDSGQGAPILLHAKPTFVAGAVEITLLAADKAPARSPRTEPAVHASLVPGKTNIAAEISAGFANQILSRLTGKQPLVVPINREEVEIQDVKLSGRKTGKAGEASLAGTASPRSMRETLRWNLLTEGDPLRVASMRATAELEDCSSLGAVAAIACNVRNGARTTAAEAFAHAFNQRYQGGLVHALLSPLDLRFSFSGQRFVLRGDLLEAAYSARGLALTGLMTAK
jgi:hypothetical protein